MHVIAEHRTRSRPLPEINFHNTFELSTAGYEALCTRPRLWSRLLRSLQAMIGGLLQSLAGHGDLGGWQRFASAQRTHATA